MKFDFIIGNPPYQEEAVGGNESYNPQIYNLFMDESYKIANDVILIHPGRFLFDAGSTPKAWNQKMLNDKHFKILFYEPDTNKVFPTASITGGIAISYHSNTKCFGEIGVFTSYQELNSIHHKVVGHKDFAPMESIVITRTAYRLTEKVHQDYPEARYKEDENGNNIGCLSKGHDYDMSSNIFERLPQVFYDQKPNDNNEYIQIYGREENQRVYKYIRRDYVNDVRNLYKFKIVLAKADGAAGTIGKPIPARIIGSSLIVSPGVATTESFITIGAFDSLSEAENAEKYIKTRFARTVLSLLKVTQEITPGKWKYVPLQDFSGHSDIDWSKPVSDIDLQLYKKYGLSDKEIEFIETYVKEME